MHLHSHPGEGSGLTLPPCLVLSDQAFRCMAGILIRSQGPRRAGEPPACARRPHNQGPLRSWLVLASDLSGKQILFQVLLHNILLGGF